MQSGDAERKKRPHIAAGFRVGHLTVERRTNEKRSGYSVWECRCDCGGVIKLDTRYLQRGTVTDCGCMKPIKPGSRDMTGLRFGKLVCIEQTAQRVRGEIAWRCQCDCGNEVLVPVRQLSNGYVKSCGCLGHPPLKAYIGKRFGKLVVRDYAGKRAGMHRWRCTCDCGNETVVGQTLLQNGKTKSCGCIRATTYASNLKLVDARR